MRYGDILVPRSDTRFPVGNVVNIGGRGREVLVEILAGLGEEPEGKGYVKRSMPRTRS